MNAHEQMLSRARLTGRIEATRAAIRVFGRWGDDVRVAREHAEYGELQAELARLDGTPADDEVVRVHLTPGGLSFRMTRPIDGAIWSAEHYSPAEVLANVPDQAAFLTKLLDWLRGIFLRGEIGQLDPRGAHDATR